MAVIRKVKKDDLKDIEYICGQTAGALCRREPIIANRVAKMYSTYYVSECSDSSFCLSDDNGKAVGYILCEPDFKRYRKLYRKSYVPKIFELNKKDGFLSWLFPIPYSFFGLKYPAHLHIDILPEYQSKGYGSEMVNTLLNYLRENNVKGVMLATDKDNTGAIRFYKRLGFKILIKSDKISGVLMGKEL